MIVADVPLYGPTTRSQSLRTCGDISAVPRFIREFSCPSCHPGPIRNATFRRYSWKCASIRCARASAQSRASSSWTEPRSVPRDSSDEVTMRICDRYETIQTNGAKDRPLLAVIVLGRQGGSRMLLSPTPLTSRSTSRARIGNEFRTSRISGVRTTDLAIRKVCDAGLLTLIHHNMRRVAELSDRRMTL